MICLISARSALNQHFDTPSIMHYELCLDRVDCLEYNCKSSESVTKFWETLILYVLSGSRVLEAKGGSFWKNTSLQKRFLRYDRK